MGNRNIGNAGNTEGLDGLGLQGDPLASIKAKQSAERFAQMAEDLQKNSSDSNGHENIQSQSTQPAQSAGPTIEEQVRSTATGPMGPKFIDALDTVLSVADIRATEIQLPMIKSKVEISPLTTEEEIALKSAAVSPETFLQKLDELIYKHSKFNDRTYANYGEFLDNLYPPDKSFMIWGLLSSTYLVLPTMESVCESCGDSFLIDAQPHEMLHEDTITEIWDEALDVKTYSEVQTVFDGLIEIELGIPSETQRMQVMRLIRPEQARDNVHKKGAVFGFAENLIFYTRSITVNGKERIVLTDLTQDIYPFLKNLNPKIKDAIRSTIDLSIFDKYMPRFYINAVCSHCGNPQEVYADPEISFFRKALSV